MKKTFLLFGFLLYSSLVTAQAEPEPQAASKSLTDAEFEQEMFSLLDMKIFHDRQIVQGTILHLYAQQASGGEARPNLTQGVLEEKDSGMLETAMTDKQIQYKLTPELMEKAQEAPFEAFKELVTTATVPKIIQEEMKQMGQMDEKAIPEMIQMVNESGPALGRGHVSVVYGDEI